MTRTERLGHDAEQLTKALRANPKMQGDWGEMILERMLEESGLRKGEEYFIQENHQTDDGRNVRPDVVVRFPERRSVVIDSKVSFTAYVNYVNATDDEQRNASLIAHVNSLRAHIDAACARIGDEAFLSGGVERLRQVEERNSETARALLER